MSVEKNVPEIRFKGFSGEWEEKELKSFCDSFSYGLNASAIKFDGVNKYLRITDIDDKSRRFDYGALTSPDVDISKSDEYLLKSGDVLFARTGASVGKTYLYNELDGKVFFAGFLIRATVNEKTRPQFIFQNTLTTAYEKFVVATSQRSGQPGINAKEYAEYRLFSPDEPEQTAIGNIFQKLDNLINQHHQKHDKLSGIKKAMLEKMFPKQGKTIPEIRFKGFSGEWEEKELSELTDYANGKGHEDKQKTSGKYELINLNSISIGGGLKPSGKFIDETNSTLEKNDLVMVLSDVGHGDLLGRVALIPKSNAYVLNQRVALLRPYGNVCPLFLLYNINAHQTYFKKQGAGMSQLNISRGSVESFYSCIPEREEQTAIGRYFQKLDSLINQHQQQITKLNNIKQACLSKMFV